MPFLPGSAISGNGVIMEAIGKITGSLYRVFGTLWVVQSLWFMVESHPRLVHHRWCMLCSRLVATARNEFELNGKWRLCSRSSTDLLPRGITELVRH